MKTIEIYSSINFHNNTYGQDYYTFYYKMQKCKWILVSIQDIVEGDIVKCIIRNKNKETVGSVNIYIIKEVRDTNKDIKNCVIISIEDILDDNLKKVYSNLLSKGVNVDPIDLGYIIQTETGMVFTIKDNNDLDSLFNNMNKNIKNHVMSIIKNNSDKRYFAFSIEHSTVGWDYEIVYKTFDNYKDIYILYRGGYTIIDLENIS